MTMPELENILAFVLACYVGAVVIAGMLFSLTTFLYVLLLGFAVLLAVWAILEIAEQRARS